MELTPEQREKIYREEKADRENTGGSRFLFFLAAGSLAALAAFLLFGRKSGVRNVSIEDLRKAYPGLSPDEEN